MKHRWSLGPVGEVYECGEMRYTAIDYRDGERIVRDMNELELLREVARCADLALQACERSGITWSVGWGDVPLRAALDAHEDYLKELGL